jgi:hypothetical protein
VVLLYWYNLLRHFVVWAFSSGPHCTYHGLVSH